jgi:thymidine phosphorylase
MVNADRSGTIAGINGWTMAGLARLAGAPSDLRSGLDLMHDVGDTVTAGEPLYVIHAGTESDLATAARTAATAHGFLIAG